MNLVVQFNLYLKQVLDIVEVVVEVRYVKGDNGGTFLWISSTEISASVYTNHNIRNRELHAKYCEFNSK